MREGVNHCFYTGTPGVINVPLCGETQDEPKERRHIQEEDGNGRLSPSFKKSLCGLK